jgi:hypothetical protein
MDTWRDRVFAYLQANGGRATASDLGQRIPHPGKYTKALQSDPRFRIERGMLHGPWVYLTGVVPAPPIAPPPTPPATKTKATKRKPRTPKEPTSKKARTKFVPAKTSVTAPPECWDIVLGSYKTWTPVLASWKWISTLSLVSKPFADALRPLRTAIIQTMALFDDRGICKSQANALFALAPKEIDPLPYSVVEIGSGWFARVMHLLPRKAVLDLAFHRHGASFERLNDAFLARKVKKERLRAARTKALFPN